jgi:hypothetical protein
VGGLKREKNEVELFPETTGGGGGNAKRPMHQLGLLGFLSGPGALGQLGLAGLAGWESSPFFI